MAESTNDIFRRNHCKTPEWIAVLEMHCFDLEIQEFFEEHAFFKIFATHCFHEIFRVTIFSIQILFKGSFQSCNKSLINHACSGPYWEHIGPWADILPVRPSRLVNKIYVYLRVVLYFDELAGQVKIQTTSKNTQRYYTSKRLISDSLSNCFHSLAFPIVSVVKTLKILKNLISARAHTRQHWTT